MSDITLITVTFPTRAEAQHVAETMIAERLAACANILAPCTSIYRWEGRIERAEEVPVLFKTRTMIAGRLRARIEELHSYDLAAIESWTAEASPEIAAWIISETT